MARSSDNYDILIVGGGVIGLSLAWELAQHDARVCVVDRGPLGQEASWAGAGMIPPGPTEKFWSKASSLEQLEGLSETLQAEWHEKLLDLTGIDNEYRRCGSLQLATNDDEACSLSQRVARWKALGTQCRELDAAAIADLEPALANNADQFSLAYCLPDEAQIRNPRHVEALIAACRMHNVTLRTGSGVEQLRVTPDHKVQAVVDNEVVPAEQICLAAGSWTGQLLKNLGINLPIRPIRGQIALLEGPPGLLKRNINVGPRYLVSRSDGHLLIGSTQEDVGFEKATTEQGIGDLRDFATSLAPHTADLPLKICWSGFRPGTPDNAPYLGQLPGFKNAWIAAGHFRAGLQLSPATAVVMREMLLGYTAQINVSGLSPVR